jgi:two-component system chemotaxis sensor kinase CheA
MGDGRVALVLDVLGLAERANVIAGGKSRTLGEHELPSQNNESVPEPLLLFASNAGGQMAIPLSLVARLEEFPRATIENLGSRQVVQYRGGILPLIDVSWELDQLPLRGSMGQSATLPEVPSQHAPESIPVIVYAEGDQLVGLIVGRVLDIVHEQIAARSRANRPGVLFTAVVQERVTEFVDIPMLVRETMFDVLPSNT